MLFGSPCSQVYSHPPSKVDILDRDYQTLFASHPCLSEQINKEIIKENLNKHIFKYCSKLIAQHLDNLQVISTVETSIITYYALFPCFLNNKKLK